MSKQLNIYDLTRDWWNFCFENPEMIKPVHTAIYMFAIEHCNRLAWKRKFGLPTTMAMEAIGVKSYNTYIKAFNELVEWGFIQLIQKSKNQHSSNIVALSKNDKAHNKALDKAMYKHGTKHTSKQSESTEQSTVSIDIPNTSNQIPNTHTPQNAEWERSNYPMSVKQCQDAGEMHGVPPENAEVFYHKMCSQSWLRFNKHNNQYEPIDNWIHLMVYYHQRGWLNKADNKNKQFTGVKTDGIAESINELIRAEEEISGD